VTLDALFEVVFALLDVLKYLLDLSLVALFAFIHLLLYNKVVVFNAVQYYFPLRIRGVFVSFQTQLLFIFVLAFFLGLIRFFRDEHFAADGLGLIEALAILDDFYLHVKERILYEAVVLTLLDINDCQVLIHSRLFSIDLLSLLVLRFVFDMVQVLNLTLHALELYRQLS
jgi:hypothetical protein